MNQLIFSNDFDIIIEEPIDYISNIDDISPNIINNIKDISNKIAIYNICDGTTICSTCFNKLNKNYYCKHCHKSYYHPYEDELRYKNAIMNYNEIDEIKNIEDNIKYYFFDIVKGNILLYVIKEHIYFNNPLTPLPFKTSSLSIQEVWHIKEDYMTNLITKEVTIYNDIDNKIDDMEEKERVYDLLYDTYLCLNNLDILKNTIYKYSLIWEGVKHLKLVKPCLVNMVYAPIHLKQFEYLVKNKLYNLAFDYTCTLNYDNKLKKLLKANLDFFREAFLESQSKARETDALLVLNMDKIKDGVVYKNYIGGSTFLEIYDVYNVGHPIYLYNDIPDCSFYDELKGMNVIVINKNLKLIKK